MDEPAAAEPIDEPAATESEAESEDAAPEEESNGEGTEDKEGEGEGEDSDVEDSKNEETTEVEAKKQLQAPVASKKQAEPEADSPAPEEEVTEEATVEREEGEEIKEEGATQPEENVKEEEEIAPPAPGPPAAEEETSTPPVAEEETPTPREEKEEGFLPKVVVTEATAAAAETVNMFKGLFKSTERKESNKIFHELDENNDNSASIEEIGKFMEKNDQLWAMLGASLHRRTEEECQSIATRVAMELASGKQGDAALEAVINKDQFYKFRTKYILDPQGNQEFFHRALFAAFDQDNNSVLDEDELIQFLDVFYQADSVFRGNRKLPPKEKLKKIILSAYDDLEGEEKGKLPFDEVREIINGQSAILAVAAEDEDAMTPAEEAEAVRIAEEKRLEEEKTTEGEKRIAEEKRIEEGKRMEEEKRLEEEARNEEEKKLEEEKRIAEEQAAKKAEEKRVAEEQEQAAKEVELKEQAKREEEEQARQLEEEEFRKMQQGNLKDEFKNHSHSARTQQQQPSFFDWLLGLFVPPTPQSNVTERQIVKKATPVDFCIIL